ncbi:MAG: YdeI/OmpD-associated family protein [Bacteroidota bacterium]
MATEDKRLDDYISKSSSFAKPILEQLRQNVHESCPTVVESIKWSFPHFEYKGSILCSMAAFKHHCAFGFWLSSVMKDPDGILLTGNDRAAMGNLGQIKSVTDLPDKKILHRYIKEAMSLIDQGVKLAKKPSSNMNKDLEIPEYFMQALKKNTKALANFEAFPYSHKKEYLGWIIEAKTEITRQKRLDTALEWIAEGKGRNWKYETEKRK